MAVVINEFEVVTETPVIASQREQRDNQPSRQRIDLEVERLLRRQRRRAERVRAD